MKQKLKNIVLWINNKFPPRVKFVIAVIATGIFITITKNNIHLLIYPNEITVSGTSMVPTLTDGQTLNVCYVNEYERGDIIAFHSKSYGVPQIFIKRVVAIPGDKVVIKEGIVYINGQAEDFSTYDNVSTLPNAESAGIAEHELTIPKNEYFVLGDNRNYSYDSREFGFVKKEKIIGILKNTSK